MPSGISWLQPLCSWQCRYSTWFLCKTGRQSQRHGRLRLLPSQECEQRIELTTLASSDNIDLLDGATIVALLPEPQQSIGAFDIPINSILEHERTWVDLLNRGDVSAAEKVFHQDCIIHITGVPEPLRGVGPWKEYVGGFLVAFPDLHFTIEDQLVSGSRAAFRWRASGTHTGPLGPVPATGKRITIEGLIIDQVVDGKVQERWEQFDQPRMLQQLGLA